MWWVKERERERKKERKGKRKRHTYYTREKKESDKGIIGISVEKRRTERVSREKSKRR